MFGTIPVWLQVFFPSIVQKQDSACFCLNATWYSSVGVDKRCKFNNIADFVLHLQLNEIFHVLW